MMRAVVLVSLCAAAVLLAVASAASAAPATLILVSGERVRGDLIDLGGVGFTVQVNGQERRIPAHEVAVIDFVGGGQGIPGTETSQIRDGQALVLMRGGGSWYGRLFDITGANPERFIFDTPDGRREVPAPEIGRILFRRWEGMPEPVAARPPAPAPVPAPAPAPVPAPAPAPAPPSGTRVSANAVWVNTGIQVRAGQMVAFKATGEVVLSGDASDTAGPAGSHKGRYPFAGAQLMSVPAGALVARVGNGPAFAIGDQTQPLRMPAAGTLFLAVNDDQPGDNRGEFIVEIIPR